MLQARAASPVIPPGKGLVERFCGYLETSFLPGRTFSCVEDFNHQLPGFFDRANHRFHRALRCRPVGRAGGIGDATVTRSTP